MSNDAPIPECKSEIDHYTGHYVPYTLRRVCGFFNVPQIYYTYKGLWDGAYSLSSLSEKTRKSNLLQMLLHFLLSYLKTPSVGPAGVWTYSLVAQQTGAYPIELTRRRFQSIKSYYTTMKNTEKDSFLRQIKCDCDRQKLIVKELINKLLL